MLVGKIYYIGHVLGVGVAEIVQVVCVIVLKCKSVLHVLHIRYVLLIKMLQVVLIFYHMVVVTQVILYISCIYLFFSKLQVLLTE